MKSAQIENAIAKTFFYFDTDGYLFGKKHAGTKNVPAVKYIKNLIDRLQFGNKDINFIMSYAFGYAELKGQVYGWNEANEVLLHYKNHVNNTFVSRIDMQP